MYDDNVTYRVGINWKDILIKLIMLILFVIILLLLFPKANLDVFYDNVYSNNVNTMKEAARNYYTVDRLPSNVGDKTSMTLKEMVDNHMLIRFTDKDGKTCDGESSYVTAVLEGVDDNYKTSIWKDIIEKIEQVTNALIKNSNKIARQTLEKIKELSCFIKGLE